MRTDCQVAPLGRIAKGLGPSVSVPWGLGELDGFAHPGPLSAWPSPEPWGMRYIAINLTKSYPCTVFCGTWVAFRFGFKTGPWLFG